MRRINDYNNAVNAYEWQKSEWTFTLSTSYKGQTLISLELGVRIIRVYLTDQILYTFRNTLRLETRTVLPDTIVSVLYERKLVSWLKGKNLHNKNMMGTEKGRNA